MSVRRSPSRRPPLHGRFLLRDRIGAHLIEAAKGGHVFVSDGSQLFDADADLFAELWTALGGESFAAVLDRVGLGGPPRIDDRPLSDPPLHALSLAIAQKCNLGCTYCYAQQGEFGGAAKNMRRETADRRSICWCRCSAGRAAQPGLPRRRTVREPAGPAGGDAPRGATRAERRGVTITFLRHDQWHPADGSRRRRFSRSLVLRSPSASTARARRTTRCGRTRADGAASTTSWPMCVRCSPCSGRCR